MSNKFEYLGVIFEGKTKFNNENCNFYKIVARFNFSNIFKKWNYKEFYRISKKFNSEEFDLFRINFKNKKINNKFNFVDNNLCLWYPTKKYLYLYENI